MLVAMEGEIILTAQDLEGLLTPEDQDDLRRLEQTYSHALAAFGRLEPASSTGMAPTMGSQISRLSK